MTRPCPGRIAWILATVLVATVGGGTAPGQTPAPADLDKATAKALRVHGEVAKPLELTPADLADLPRQAVTAKAHDGRESKYEGVSLHDVLRKAALPAGNELRGKAVAMYVIVEAADGYQALFALPELDPAFTDRVILLADHRDGQPLDARTGPFQIVVPGEKKHARWVRQVTGLRIGKG
jgi:DMSO/TMAO reductase YedYZ molybdopterin-dependent catalytic subunit